MTAPGSAATIIAVTTTVFPLGGLLERFDTTVTIDGTDHVVPWGTHVFAVEPGPHEVAVTFRYLSGRRLGRNAVTVDVAAGTTVDVRYRSPLIVFMKGRITVGP